MGPATVLWASGRVEPSGVQATTKVQGAEWGLKWFRGLAVESVPVELKPQPKSKELDWVCNRAVGWRRGGTNGIKTTTRDQGNEWGLHQFCGSWRWGLGTQWSESHNQRRGN